MTDQKNQVEIPTYLKLSKIAVWLMYFWVIIGIVSLALRVFLLAFSANMNVGFSQFVLNVSDDYLEPFRGIFTPAQVGETGYLDVSAIFAIIVYMFVAWGFSALVGFIQNKIDVSRLNQEKEIAKLQREKESEAMRSQKVVVERTVRTTPTKKS